MFVFVLLFLFVPRICCFFLYIESYIDYVKVRLLSFVAIQCDGLACFSQFNHSKDKPVLRPGEATKASDGKKKKCSKHRT